MPTVTEPPTGTEPTASIAFMFLGGTYHAASRVGDRSEPEWPPHFGRAFMAMVAALYRWPRDNADPAFLAERSALLELERLPAPSIWIPPACPVGLPARPPTVWEAERTVEVYVRRNHVQGMSGSGVGRLLPWSQRGKVARFFPGMLLAPEQASADLSAPLPEVHYIWTGEVARRLLAIAEPLAKVLASVTYLGTSRSLVSADICHTPPAANLRPLTLDERPAPSDLSVRVPTEGRLAALEAHYERRKRSEVPPVGEVCRYRPCGPRADPPPLIESAFGDVFPYSLEGREWLPLTGTLRITNGFRETVLSRAGERGRAAVVSGHGDDPDDRPDHLAWVPLANVGYEHATGRILGVGVVLPRSVVPGTDGRPQALAALAGLRPSPDEGAVPLRLGEQGCPRIRAATAGTGPASLDTRRYTEPSRYWASVTPFVSEFLGTRDNHDARRLVRRACRSVGLPDPVDCTLTRVGPVRGVPPSDHFLTRREPSGPAYGCRHVIIDFGQPVRGPVMIGRYRYFGMGLCLPRKHWYPGSNA